jgi:hypothetical protein
VLLPLPFNDVRDESHMGILRLVHERGDERFEIVECTDMLNTTEKWFDIYRYVAGKNTHDHTQPGIRLATLCALHEWNVPLEKWRAAFSGEAPLYEHIE